MNIHIETQRTLNLAVKSTGITRKVLAKRMNVHPSFITKILNNEVTNISLATLDKFARAIGKQVTITIK